MTQATLGEPFEVQDIPLDRLFVSESNVRRQERSADIDELAASIRRDGLQQAIVVQPANGRFEILIGQRRFIAAKLLNLPSLPARVRRTRLNAFDAKVISFAENVQRRDLSPRDKAEACQYLLDELRTVAAVAERLGVTEQTVRKWLGYAGVHEGLKELVEEGQITVPTAMRLAEYVEDERKAVQIAERIGTTKPPPRHRDRILAAVEEAPDRSVDTIFKRADEKRREKTVTFVLPEKWALSLERASRRLRLDASQLARDATIEWLTNHRF